MTKGQAGQDMNEAAKGTKAKEPLTPMAQPIVEGLDRDQICDLESSEAPVDLDNMESDIDSEVVKPELVTKKTKGNIKDKNKDKVPILNLRDEVRANRKNIPNTGRLAVCRGPKLPDQDNHSYAH